MTTVAAQQPAFLRSLEGVRAQEASGGWLATCPCHPDQTRSLFAYHDPKASKWVLTCLECDATEREILKASGLKRADLLTGEETSTGVLSLRPLDSYQVRQVEWLDKPFLQRSAFHLFAGKKGSCKGTYLCGLAARITLGLVYPEPKRVLVVTSEDSIELDFLPRLLAAGGTASLVSIVNGPFLLPRDLEWLQETAVGLGDVGLIVLDPIGNHLGGADTDKEGLVRVAIGPLNALADDLNCIVFGVRHLGKDVSRGVLASVLGSTAWVDVPRCVILMAADDEDEMLFHAQVVAGNRGPRNAGRAFRLSLVDVAPATEITLVTPEGESLKDVEELLGKAGNGRSELSRSGKARELVLDILEQEGQQESDVLDARVAAETGLAAKTVRNARTALKNEGLIAAVPVRDEGGEVACWHVRRTNAPRPHQVPTVENSFKDLAQPGPGPNQLPGEGIKGPSSPGPHPPARGPSGTSNGHPADDEDELARLEAIAVTLGLGADHLENVHGERRPAA